MIRRALLAALLATASAGARAAEPPKPTRSALPDVKQWQLPNGLRVLFLADHKAPVVTVQVFYHAGSKDEPQDRRGIAHMFEHMMFKGSRHVKPEEHARFVDAVGGNENAFTQDDLTAYHDTVPPSALDFTLQLEAERMRNLTLIQKTIDSEREVVKEEHRVSLENNPVTKAFDKILHLAYTLHPYHELAIGDPKMLDRVSVADCQTFYDAWYQPNNATLIVVGDTDEATVRKLAEARFGSIPRGPDKPHKSWNEPEQASEKHETLKLPVRLPVLIGAYHIPAAASDDIYPLEVLQQVLSGGESSRLYKRLVRKDQTAVAAGGFVFAKEDPGLFLTFAAFLPNADVAKIRAALSDEIARVAKEPVDEKELAKAKNQLAARAVFARERVSSTATSMGVAAYVDHDPLRPFTSPAKYDAVTAADVLRVAKTYFVPSHFSEVTLQPQGGGK
jgi:zinc protease